MSNLQSYIHYSINGVPLLTYGFIGITTVVLATVTLFESNNDVEDISIIPETMVSQLPSVESFNPFASTIEEKNEQIPEEEPEEEIEEAEPIEEEEKEERIEKNPLLGGKKRKNKTNKRKHKKNRQNKTKHHK